MASRSSHASSLAEQLLSSRSLLITDSKHGLWSTVMKASSSVNSESTDEEARPRVAVDRVRAVRAANKTNVTPRSIKRTLFGQLMEQLAKSSAQAEAVRAAQSSTSVHAVPKDVVQRLRRPSRAWKIDFQGEGSIDAGGPYHESVSQVCTELMAGSQTLPLLIPIPADRSHAAAARARQPHPSLTAPFHARCYEFLGILMGIALRTEKPLDLSLSRMVGGWVCVPGESRVTFQCR